MCVAHRGAKGRTTAAAAAADAAAEVDDEKGWVRPHPPPTPHSPTRHPLLQPVSFLLLCHPAQIRCSLCRKWRRVPEGVVVPAVLGTGWVCEMGDWGYLNDQTGVLTPLACNVLPQGEDEEARTARRLHRPARLARSLTFAPRSSIRHLPFSAQKQLLLPP